MPLGSDHSLLDALPVGVWIGEIPDGRTAYANAAFRALFGEDARPALLDRSGQPVAEGAGPFARAFASGQRATVDGLVLHRSDGRTVHLLAIAEPRRGEDGTIDQVVVTYLDVTREVAA